ncbi:hypothetical protein V6N13_081229 [Hibiscus sabdariffa]
MPQQFSATFPSTSATFPAFQVNLGTTTTPGSTAQPSPKQTTEAQRTEIVHLSPFTPSTNQPTDPLGVFLRMSLANTEPGRTDSNIIRDAFD